MSIDKSIISLSPLFAPVSYAGQTYFTSQYFHREYLANSQYGGKYQRHADFIRKVRAIEAYDLYVHHGDIVELTFARIKTEVTQILRYWQPLFQAGGYRLLVLLNATAQVALSHHLDDELSQQMSVAANTSVARQMTGHVLPSTATEVLLMQSRIVTQALEQLAHLERAQQALAQEQDALGQRLAAIESRRPPQDKLRPGEWLRRYSKPHLGVELMGQLNAACRRRENAERWRPDGYDFQIPYYTPETIAAAYDEVTRQISFLHDPGVVYERRRRP